MLNRHKQSFAYNTNTSNDHYNLQYFRKECLTDGFAKESGRQGNGSALQWTNFKSHSNNHSLGSLQQHSNILWILDKDWTNNITTFTNQIAHRCIRQSPSWAIWSIGQHGLPLPAFNHTVHLLTLQDHKFWTSRLWHVPLTHQLLLVLTLLLTEERPGWVDLSGWLVI